MPLSRRDLCRLVGAAAALPAVLPPSLQRRSRREPAGPIRLDSNENPYGPSPAARAAITAALGDSGRYPGSQPLVAAIARENGVGEANVLLTVGATEGLGLCARAFTTPEAGLVTGAPSYGAIGTATEGLGHPVVRVPVMSDGGLDLEAMLSAAQGGGVLYLCNPNNPTGTLILGPALREAVARLERDAPRTTLVVGEAYHEYVGAAEYRSAVSLAVERPRVVVNRTFSKLYALAGLRLGYLIGHADTIRSLMALRVPIGASVPGIAAGLAVLADGAERNRQRRLNSAGRAATERFFHDRGWRYYPAHANYLFVEVGRDITGFRADCEKAGLLIGRHYPPADTWARLTIGTPDEMRRALPIFEAVYRGR